LYQEKEYWDPMKKPLREKGNEKENKVKEKAKQLVGKPSHGSRIRKA
jgi:hypothetical protein